MQKWMLIFLICLSASYVPNNVYATTTDTQTIVFFRHGEKPLFDFGQLTCQGLNRSLALPKLLVEKFGKPNYLFAPNPYSDGLYYYVRALITMEPTAITLSMPVNTDFHFHNDDAFIKEILSQKYHQSLLFISWEHLYIYKIVTKMMQMLNVNIKIPLWPENDYDSLYVIKIDWRQYPPVISFIHDNEKLNNQSDNCPTPVDVNQKFKKMKNALFSKIFIFIPAAEPLNETTDQLSCKGLNRALALTEFLDEVFPDINAFVLPSAKRKAKAKNQALRALMTIEPTMVIRGGLFLPTSYHLTDDAQGIKSLSTFKEFAAITWPIEEMAKLARELYAMHGGNPNEIPDPVPNMNTIYQITVNYIGSTAKPEFKIVIEDLPVLSTICPEPASNSDRHQNYV